MQDVIEMPKPKLPEGVTRAFERYSVRAAYYDGRHGERPRVVHMSDYVLVSFARGTEPELLLIDALIVLKDLQLARLQ